MTGWMSGGGGMMAVVAGAETGSSAFELFEGKNLEAMTFYLLKFHLLRLSCSFPCLKK